jgi:hypothetical protein
LNGATMQSLLRVLEAAVHAWLQSNHFRPRKLRRGRPIQEQALPTPPDHSGSAISEDSRQSRCVEVPTKFGSLRPNTAKPANECMSPSQNPLARLEQRPQTCGQHKRPRMLNGRELVEVPASARLVKAPELPLVR